ncbi:MAG: hypothetical protein NT154_19080 [Verrucomicrobia bacterium]|nr:hypothetical protein [Verrucomicrobiota bacterium]
MKTTYCLLQVTTLAAALNLQASIVSTVRTGTYGTFAVSKVDLMNAGSPSFSSISIDQAELYGSTVSALNDGDIYGGLSPGVTGPSLTPADGAVVTIVLDTTSRPQGYDIKGVVSLTGYAQRALQSYDVAVATVSSGGAFTHLFSITNAGVQTGETQVATQDDQGQPLATGVQQIQITFHNAGPNHYQSVYREFDVFATGASPTLTTQPQNQVVEAGASASFWVVPGTQGTFGYQWLFNGAVIDAGLNPTATTTNLVLPSVGLTDIGAYSVVVDSVSGMASSSNALLSVTMGNALLNVLNGPNGTLSALVVQRYHR